MTNVQRARETKKLVQRDAEAQKRVDEKKVEKIKEGQVVEDREQKKEMIAKKGG